VFKKGGDDAIGPDILVACFLDNWIHLLLQEMYIYHLELIIHTGDLSDKVIAMYTIIKKWFSRIIQLSLWDQLCPEMII
jgi:hypothetical protein